MAENHSTTTEPNQLNGAQKQQAIPKRTRRKQLPNATASSTVRTEITLKAVVSSTPKSVSSDDFPLYKPFVLDNAGTSEWYIKITKHKIVNCITGDFYNSQVSGYLLSI